MENNLEPQMPFIRAWLKDLSEEVDDEWYRIIPIWIGMLLAIGGVVAYFLPDAFWSQDRDTATIVYASILTFNGIILALSWSAFSRIYDMIGAGKFSAFLNDNEMLDSYLFALRYIHASQMVAMIVSLAAVMLAQFSIDPLAWQRLICAATLGFTMYAIKQAAMAVGIMQDLVRYRAIFDAENQGRNNLRAA